MTPDDRIAAERVQRADPMRFAAIMAAPAPARPVLFAVAAYNVEIARAPWVSAEPMVAEMRLQWWIDALERGQIPHEIGPALEAAIAAGVPVALLVEAAEARRWDCWSEPFSDQTAFESYIDATSGGLLMAAAQGLGVGTEAAPAMRSAGWGAGLAQFLCAIPELEARGRVPLLDGLPEAVSALARQGLARLADAEHARKALDVDTRERLAPVWLQTHAAPGILKRAAANPVRVAQSALMPSEFARRAGLLFAALRRP